MASVRISLFVPRMPVKNNYSNLKWLCKASIRAMNRGVRGCTYPNDLRWRMVYQREALQLSCEALGSNLGVDPSTVCRTVSLYLRTSKVDKKKYSADNLPRKLTDNIKFFYYAHCAR